MSTKMPKDPSVYAGSSSVKKSVLTYLVTHSSEMIAAMKTAAKITSCCAVVVRAQIVDFKSLIVPLSHCAAVVWW